jgi:hypothetical protein
MKRKRYTEEQIITILKEHEAGASLPVADAAILRLRQVHSVRWLICVQVSGLPKNAASRLPITCL